MADPATEAEAAAAAAIERGRLLFARASEFVTGVARIDQLPDSDLVEVAFAGRSNVGKSSLLNAVTGRKALARTSHTPGRTREINFFSVDGRLHLVDLPGYGYARASKTDIARWTRLIHDYLRGRPQLRRAFLLIDARHGIKDTDNAVMDLLDTAAVSYQAVLTKADKVKPQALEAVVAATAAKLASHGAAHPEIIVTSTVKGAGIAELRAALAPLADGA